MASARAVRLTVIARSLSTFPVCSQVVELPPTPYKLPACPSDADRVGLPQCVLSPVFHLLDVPQSRTSLTSALQAA